MRLKHLIDPCFSHFSGSFEDDVMKVWQYESSVEQYQSLGGTSKAAVLKQVTQLTSLIEK